MLQLCIAQKGPPLWSLCRPLPTLVMVASSPWSRDLSKNPSSHPGAATAELHHLNWSLELYVRT